MNGSVKFFNHDRGYGFIESREAGDVFFHFSHYHGEEDELRTGLPVTFTLSEGKKGVMATDISEMLGGTQQ